MKDALPDLTWMKEYMPEQTVDALSKHLSDLANSVSLPDTVTSSDRSSLVGLSRLFIQTNLQDRVRQLQERFSNFLSTSTPSKTQGWHRVAYNFLV